MNLWNKKASIITINDPEEECVLASCWISRLLTRLDLHLLAEDCHVIPLLNTISNFSYTIVHGIDSAKYTKYFYGFVLLQCYPESPPPVTGLLLCIFICRQCDIGSHTQPLSNKFLEGFSGLLELSSTRNCLVKINIITLSDARRWSRLNRPLCLSVLIFQPFVIIILWR